MAADKTVVTELATALGMAGHSDIESTLSSRPAVIDLPTAVWDQLQDLWSVPKYHDSFRDGFANGLAFSQAPDALAGRPPRLIEWTGGRKAPGDEVVPADLRIDHVYLVSCKYLSRILHNLSPTRLVDASLSRERPTKSGDWFGRVAPGELQNLYEACVDDLGLRSRFPTKVGDVSRTERRLLAKSLAGDWSPAARPLYQELCTVVGERTAAIWRKSTTAKTRERLTWRLLRIGSAPYYVLGSSAAGSMRLRVATPWDFRRLYEIKNFEITSEQAGQPRVNWVVHYENRASQAVNSVCGHVEFRWSHGRFGQPPEAKVYLDTPHEDVPGYFSLESAR